MAGAPITQAEIERAAKEIQKRKLTWEQGKDNSIGRVDLGRMLGVTEVRAKGILQYLRNPGTLKETKPIKPADPAPPVSSEYSDLAEKLDKLPIKIPDWTRRPRSSGDHQVIPTVQCSDWHLDEVVKPEQVNWRNAYDREIAEMRLQNFFQNAIKVSKDYIQGFSYPGIVVACCGDMVSGNIHEELRATNADVVLGTILHWVPKMAAGLKMLAEEFGQVWVPWVVGNHGRNTLKPIHKNRVRDNFDWMFGRILQRELAGDKRIEFAVASGARQFFTLYGTAYMMSHGDEARGGSGIAGLLSPLMIADARARKNYKYDYWVCGHWHQAAVFKRIIVNGSGKGYDEYASDCNFEAEPPKQNLWFTDPARGIICSWPVFVMDKLEPWMAAVPKAKTSPVLFDAKDAAA